MTIGQKIELALVHKGLSQAELAKRIGVSPSTISRLIDDKSEPSPVIVGIARELGLSIDFLVDRTKDWPPQPDALSNLRAIPDGVLLEEVLRRRRAMNDILTECLNRYREIRKHVNEARTANANGMAGPLSGEGNDQIRRLLDEAYDFVAVHREITIDPWSGFVERWEDISDYPLVDAPDFDDMIVFFDTLTAARSSGAPRSVAQDMAVMWGIMPSSVKRNFDVSMGQALTAPLSSPGDAVAASEPAKEPPPMKPARRTRTQTKK